MLGATNGVAAAPGTIRGDFSISKQNNLIHGSDSPESAAREIALWFKPEEVVDYAIAGERVGLRRGLSCHRRPSNRRSCRAEIAYPYAHGAMTMPGPPRSRRSGRTRSSCSCCVASTAFVGRRPGSATGRPLCRRRPRPRPGGRRGADSMRPRGLVRPPGHDGADGRVRVDVRLGSPGDGDRSLVPRPGRPTRAEIGPELRAGGPTWRQARPRREAERLRAEIDRHNRLYYVEAAPEISDREYDRLMKRLEAIEAEHPELVTPDSPTQRVGGEPLDAFATVTHAVPMLSIENTYNFDEVREWDARVRKGLNRRRAGPLRRRAEGRRRGRLAPLRGRQVRPGRDPRRRRARRRRHGQPPDRPRHPPATGRRPAAHPGGPRRGLHDQRRAGPAQRAPRARPRRPRSPTPGTRRPARSSCSTRSSAPSDGSGSSPTAWARCKGLEATSYSEILDDAQGAGASRSARTTPSTRRSTR